MLKQIARICTLSILIIFITGCSFTASNTTDPAPLYTAAAQTIAVTLTQGALYQTINAPAAATATPEPAAPAADTPQPEVPSTPLIVPTTALPTVEILQTSTPSKPMISASQNTNCRSGPGSIWPIVSALMVGDTVEVRGKNDTGKWWYIEDPDSANDSCWVWTDTTTVVGNTSNLPIIPTPFTPTPSAPTITLSSSVSPVNYTGPCPKTLTLTGTIKTDLGTEVTYRWAADFPATLAFTDYTFIKAGTKTFTETLDINADTEGYLRFRVYNPYEVKDERIKIKINCD